MTRPLTIALIGACVYACSNDHIMQPKQPLDQSFYETPHTDSFVVNDNHKDRQPQEVSEIDTYNASIAHINAVMRQETTQLSLCRYSDNESDCGALRRRICWVPEMIDSRGGIHLKTYCIGRTQ
jgi:hypothetical protein